MLNRDGTLYYSLVSGRISSKNPIPDLKLVATSELRKLEIETSKTPTGYSFSFLALPGEDVAFNPKSEEHLFDPESLHVSVDNDCHLVHSRLAILIRKLAFELIQSVPVHVTSHQCDQIKIAKCL